MNMNTLPNNADRIVTVVVDMQNDFCLPQGTLPVPEAEQAIEPMNELTEYTRKQNGIVVATRDQHPSSTPHFDTWPVHCVAGTAGAAFHRDLQLHSTDYVINKGTGQTDGYSGYEGIADDNKTTLEQLVQPRSPQERVAVILGGVATDYCVLNTALDAAKQAQRVKKARQGIINVYLAQDAVRAVNIQPNDGENAIKEMEAAGVIMTTTADIIGGTVGVEA